MTNIQTIIINYFADRYIDQEMVCNSIEFSDLNILYEAFYSNKPLCRLPFAFISVCCTVSFFGQVLWRLSQFGKIFLKYMKY